MKKKKRLSPHTKKVVTNCSNGNMFGDTREPKLLKSFWFFVFVGLQNAAVEKAGALGPDKKRKL